MKLIKTLFAVIFILVSIFIAFLFTIDFDANENLEKSYKAFNEINYSEMVFVNQERLEEFANFLLVHESLIRNYNQHEDYRSIQFTKRGGTARYTNKGDCFKMLSFHESFQKEYIPSHLIDSLNYYYSRLTPDLISSVTICSSNYKFNIRHEEGSISFRLNHENWHKPTGSFSMKHHVTVNLKNQLKNQLNSIYDKPLVKDTSIFNELKYRISITPNTGFR